jgi:hypothetical protein
MATLYRVLDDDDDRSTHYYSFYYVGGVKPIRERAFNLWRMTDGFRRLESTQIFMGGFGFRSVFQHQTSRYVPAVLYHHATVPGTVPAAAAGFPYKKKYYYYRYMYIHTLL